MKNMKNDTRSCILCHIYSFYSDICLCVFIHSSYIFSHPSYNSYILHMYLYSYTLHAFPILYTLFNIPYTSSYIFHNFYITSHILCTSYILLTFLVLCIILFVHFLTLYYLSYSTYFFPHCLYSFVHPLYLFSHFSSYLSLLIPFSHIFWYRLLHYPFYK